MGVAESSSCSSWARDNLFGRDNIANGNAITSCHVEVVTIGLTVPRYQSGDSRAIWTIERDQGNGGKRE